jgi:hypothetical protein
MSCLPRVRDQTNLSHERTALDITRHVSQFLSRSLDTVSINSVAIS